MRFNVLLAALWIALLSNFALAETKDVTPVEARQAAVVFLGEQHDNPAHHAVQAAWVKDLGATSVVFEMLTADQASAVTRENRVDRAALEAALDWSTSGWPDFAMYYPIFNAAPEAVVFGAGVPRARLRAAMTADLSSVLGAAAAQRFGIDKPLPPEQQKSREALQRAAHCDALPEELLPKMVSVQRLRDAALAQAALQAYEELGGPVVVITGNGHARTDWGAPYILQQAAPDLAIFSLGQGEAGRMPNGSFEGTVDGPAVDRGDPCDAFNK